MIHANSCREARNLFAEYENQIGLLFSDIQLDDGDGITLAKELYQKNNSLQILFCSGNSISSYQMNECPWSKTHFIQKPFSLVSMTKKVSELLQV